MHTQHYGAIYQSSIGDIGIMADTDSLLRVEVLSNLSKQDKQYAMYHNLSSNALTKEAVHYLNEYLEGKARACTLPLAPSGTPFQQRVWALLQDIPFGTTKTYKEIALLLGQPNAIRAVGNACAKNPILFCIPCHRVVRSGLIPHKSPETTNKEGRKHSIQHSDSYNLNTKYIGGYRGGAQLKLQLLMLERSVVKKK